MHDPAATPDEAAPVTVGALGAWRRPGVRWLAALLLVDGLCLGLHALEAVGVLHGARWSIDTDRGVAEWFQYGKYVAAAVLLAVIARRRADTRYGAWALVFVVALVDDAGSLHEAAGDWLAPRLGAVPVVGAADADDVGEAIAVGAVGGALLVMLAAAYWHGDAAFRRFSRVMLVLLGALAAAGVGADYLHSVFFYHDVLGRVLMVAEDWGEMLAMSAIVAYAASAARRTAAGGTLLTSPAPPRRA